MIIVFGHFFPVIPDWFEPGTVFDLGHMFYQDPVQKQVARNEMGVHVDGSIAGARSG
jgi:hypothetical protein